MTVRATNNGYKALARKGTAGQEVFISTTEMEIEDVKASQRAPVPTDNNFSPCSWLYAHALHAALCKVVVEPYELYIYP